MPAARIYFVVAVQEIVTNAVRHGGGSGKLRLWYDRDLLCEITDHGGGFPSTPDLDRTTPPTATAHGGRGLWLAQQATTELAIRSGTGGSAVRLKASLTG